MNDGGELLAMPYDPERGGIEKVQKILDHAAAHPQWFSGPSDPEDRMALASWLLHHPEHLTWEVWREGELVGILLLWKITPKTDALLHFVFFDHNLAGKVGLLQRFLGYCFRDLGFQRITMEVPEDVEKLVSFARRKLSFRYEGEAAVKSHPLVAELERATGSSGNPHTWVATQGSRKERAHWRDGKWLDLICLRLTAPEYEALHPGDSV